MGDLAESPHFQDLAALSPPSRCEIAEDELLPVVPLISWLHFISWDPAFAFLIWVDRAGSTLPFHLGGPSRIEPAYLLLVRMRVAIG